MAELSPMMRQYLEIKNANPDCIIFFRLGDFYEMFFDDAIKASKELELTLTGRDCGLPERAPMCGVPYHSKETYIAKLVANGHKVAICEQTEEAGDGKKLVRREIVRIITPGTVIESSMLDASNNNYICVIYTHKRHSGVVFCDTSTGKLLSCELFGSDFVSRLKNEIFSFTPNEILCNEETLQIDGLKEYVKEKLNRKIEILGDNSFSGGKNVFNKYFPQIRFEETEFSNNNCALSAVAGLMSYLKVTQMCGLERILEPKFYFDNNYMSLDYNTKRNLEIVKTMRTGEKRGSLLWVLDETQTSMGKRLLHSWLEKPLMSCKAINERQDAVSELVDNISLRCDLQETMGRLIDIERTMTRVVYGEAGPKDVYALGESFALIPIIKSLLKETKSDLLKKYYNDIDELADIKDLILSSIKNDPPSMARDGGIFIDGYCEEIDKLRYIMTDANSILTAITERERERTNIPKLKIGYNKVFGYYIEVSNSYKDLVPDTYIRKQTLVNGERYITGELKDVETSILTAKDRDCQLEYEMFKDILKKISSQLERIEKTTEAIACIDVISSLAQVASDNRYCRPEVDTDNKIVLKDSRHPVVESLLNDAPFVPNDVCLDCESNRTAIITGPNMAGKSTYMRQVALITIMAQIGSFVPAESAKIGICDAVFTRIGASDDLTTGQSTFMVEMNEVAHIVKSATKNSLLILDEIGRGTSTYDGMSIARAVLEYVADKEVLGAKTLFATHYHELTALENLIDGVKNYNIAVKKRGFDITFLRRIVPGGADESYGVEVAKLAGVPDSIILRAKEILEELENGSSEPVRVKKVIEYDDTDTQKDYSQIIKKIKEIDVNTLTPIESMSILYTLTKEVNEG